MQQEQESSPELEKIIRQRIRAEGGIRFAEYMALCLYHPQFGYYMAPRERIGRQGDFFTSTSVHSLFGVLVSRQLRQMWEIMGEEEFVIAEQGAGEGHLALDILDALQAESPQFYNRMRYRIVELSEDNRSRQRSVLEGHLDKLDWCALDDLRGMQGCILSNELVDAFPVHLLEKKGGELLEVFVVETQDGLGEELRPAPAEIRDHFSRLGIEPAEGNRAEVNLDAVKWMEQVGRTLSRGFVLTIDYGYAAEDLYAPFRRGGTLMCYHRHSANEDPFVRIGRQDITAHVDFSALQLSGRKKGLEPLWFGEQYRFLMGLGFVEALMELEARQSDEKIARDLRLTLKNLILPETGMGETFKALIQGKGVGRPDLLCARSMRDLSMLIAAEHG